jgi:hypothetical protein
MRRLLRALITPNRRGRSTTRALRVVFVLLIIIFIYDWWKPIGVLVGILTPRVSPTPTISFVDLCVALAGMNAIVGAIVVVFVVLAIQELRVLRINPPLQVLPSGEHVRSNGQVEGARVRRDKSRLDMLLGVAIVSFVILMLVAVVMLFGLVTALLDAKNIAIIGLAGFTYGLASIAIAIYSYRILESPFVRVTSPQLL